MKQMLLDLSPTPRQSFDNFVVGQNIEVVHTLKEIISDKLPIQFVYLWGNEGSGKSHLAHIASDHGFLIHDDVHLLDEPGQIELFNTYNRCKDSRQNMLVTGLYSPLQMKLRDDLADRFGRSNCYWIDWSEYKDANECLAKEGINGILKKIGESWVAELKTNCVINGKKLFEESFHGKSLGCGKRNQQ